MNNNSPRRFKKHQICSTAYSQGSKARPIDIAERTRKSGVSTRCINRFQIRLEEASMWDIYGKEEKPVKTSSAQ
jgi:hypothetical protein